MLELKRNVSDPSGILSSWNTTGLGSLVTQALELGKLRGNLSSLIGKLIEFHQFFIMVLVGKFLLKFGVWRSWKCLILSTRIHGEVPFRGQNAKTLRMCQNFFSLIVLSENWDFVHYQIIMFIFHKSSS